MSVVPRRVAPRDARRTWLLWAVAAVVGAAALAGAALAGVMLATEAGGEGARVGDTVETSFGSLTVDAARLLPASDMPMAMAGMSATAMGHEDRLQVSVTLVNRGPDPAPYAHDQFRLFLDRGEAPARAVDSDDTAGSLMPRAAITLQLEFPVGDHQGAVQLEYQEHAGSPPRVVDLDTVAVGGRDRHEDRAGHDGQDGHDGHDHRGAR